MISKKELRREQINRRKVMSEDEVVTKSSLICDKIIKSSCYKESNVIYCYSAVNNEVKLDTLIANAFASGKTVAFPRVEGENIRFYEINSLDELSKGYYGILEPDTEVEAPNADLIIVPGVAFGRNGKRLGYGGGFYDRFLADNQIYSIGVCYNFQLTDDIPTEDFDRILNEIVTN